MQVTQKILKEISEDIKSRKITTNSLDLHSRKEFEVLKKLVQKQDLLLKK